MCLTIQQYVLLDAFSPTRANALFWKDGLPTCVCHALQRSVGSGGRAVKRSTLFQHCTCWRTSSKPRVGAENFALCLFLVPICQARRPPHCPLICLSKTTVFTRPLQRNKQRHKHFFFFSSVPYRIALNNRHTLSTDTSERSHFNLMLELIHRHDNTAVSGINIVSCLLSDNAFHCRFFQ